MKTKFLSLLMVICICLTVGGVYATWYYAETLMQTVHGHLGFFNLADASTNHEQGTFTVNAGNVKLIIDQTSETDYTAQLKAEGTITFSFTPSETYEDQHFSETKVTVVYGVTTTNDNPTGFPINLNDGNDPKGLFTKFDKTNKNELELIKGQDGVYTAMVDASKLLDFMTLNTFKLDTFDKYTAFSQALGIFGQIGVDINFPTT